MFAYRRVKKRRAMPLTWPTWSVSDAGDASRRLAGRDGWVVPIAAELVDRCEQMTRRFTGLKQQIKMLVEALPPSLLALDGCGHLTAVKLIGEAAGIDRFTSRDAFAIANGTAPVPVWSGNQEWHRLNRGGTDSSTPRSTASRSRRCAATTSPGLVSRPPRDIGDSYH